MVRTFCMGALVLLMALALGAVLVLNHGPTPAPPEQGQIQMSCVNLVNSNDPAWPPSAPAADRQVALVMVREGQLILPSATATASITLLKQATDRQPIEREQLPYWRPVIERGVQGRAAGGVAA